MPFCGDFDIAQHGADVNGLAEIATKVFSELLHEENLTQRRGDAKKFFDTNSTNYHGCKFSKPVGLTSL